MVDGLLAQDPFTLVIALSRLDFDELDSGVGVVWKRPRLVGDRKRVGA